MKKNLLKQILTLALAFCSVITLAQSSVNNLRLNNDNPCFGDNVVLTAAYVLDAAVTPPYDVSVDINGFDTIVSYNTAGDQNFTVPASRIQTGTNTLTVEVVAGTVQNMNNVITFEGRDFIDVDFRLIPDNAVCVGENIVLEFFDISGGDTLDVQISLNGTTLAGPFTIIPQGSGQKLTDTIYAAFISPTPLNQNIVIEQVTDEAGCMVAPVGLQETVKVFPNPQAAFNPIIDTNRLGFVCDNNASVDVPILFSDAQNNAIAYYTVTQNAISFSDQSNGVLTPVGAGQFTTNIVLNNLTALNLLDVISIRIDSVSSGTGAQECTFVYAPGTEPTLNFNLHQTPNVNLNIANNPVCAGIDDTLSLSVVSGDPSGLVAYFDGTDENFSIAFASNEFIRAYTQTQNFLLDSVTNDFCIAEFNKEDRGTLNVNPLPAVDAASFSSVCVGQSADIAINIDATAGETYFLRYRITGPAGNGDSLYMGLQNGLNTLVFNAPNALAAIGNYTITFDSLANEVTGCSAPLSNLTVDGMAGNVFSFDITDTLDAQVLFNGMQNAFLCAPVANGEMANVDSVEVRFYINDLVSGVPSYDFFINRLFDGQPQSLNQLVTANAVDFVADATLPGFTHYFPFMVERPTDTLAIELVSLEFNDANGNDCNSVFNLALPQYTAQASVRSTPSLVVNSASPEFDCTDLNNIVYNFNIANIDSIEFVIENVSDPMNPVQVGATAFIGSLGGRSIFDSTFAELAAIAGAPIMADVNYRIRFQRILQTADANFAECAYTLSPAPEFNAYLVPTPTLVSLMADPMGVCKDSASILTLVAQGDFQFSFDLTRTIGAAETTNRFNFSPAAVYDAGANTTTFELPVLPPASAQYDVDSLFITFMGERCASVGAPPLASVNVNVEPTISSVTLTSNVSTICAGQMANLTVNTVGGDANYDFNIYEIVGEDTVSNIAYNEASVISYTLMDSTRFVVHNLRNSNGLMCPSAATDDVNVNVNPNAFANVLSGDSVFCSVDNAGIRLAVSAVGDANITFNVFDNTAGMALAPFTINYTPVNDVDTVFFPVPLDAGQDLTYTLSNLTDNSSPACVVPVTPTAVNLQRNINPIAELTLMPMDVCFDGNVQFRLNFAGGNANNNTAVSYKLRYQGGMDIPTMPNPRLTQDTALANNSSFIAATINNLTADTTFELYDLVDASGCVSNVVLSERAIVRNALSLTNAVSVFDTICHDSDPRYILEFSEINTNIDVYYNGLITPITVESEDTITIMAPGIPGNVLFNIDSIAYTGTDCYVKIDSALNVLIATQAELNVVNVAMDPYCFGDSVAIILRSTVGDGLISGSLTDGMTGNYNFELDAGTTDTIYIQDLDAGNYAFQIQDAFYTTNEGICNAAFGPTVQNVTVEDEIIASVSIVGNNNVCEGDNVPFSVTVSSGPGLLPNPFNLRYLINGVLDSITITNSPQIVNLEVDQSGDVEFLDITEINGQNCSYEINRTFPIVVRNRPSLTLNSANNSCAGENVDLNLSFEGIAPFFVRISNIGVFTFADVAGTGDTIITVTPNATITYEVEELSDASQQGCANALLMPAPSTTINVVPKAIASITASQDTICRGDAVMLNFRVSNVVPNINNQVRLTFVGVGGNNQNIILNEDGANPGEYIASQNSSPQADIIYRVVNVEDGSSPACNFMYNDVSDTVVVFDNITASITASTVDVCNNESSNLSINLTGRAGQQVSFTLRDEMGNDSTRVVPANSSTPITINNIETDKEFSLVDVFYVNQPSCILGAPVSILINHNEAPEATIDYNGRACAGEEFEFDLDIVDGEGDVTVTFLTNTGNSFQFTGTVAGSPYRVPFTANNPDSLEIRIASIESSSSRVCSNPNFMGDTIKLRVFPIPSATISVDRPTIVAGSSADLLFVVSGDTVNNPENIQVEYAIDGVAGNFVEDNGAVPGFVIANNVNTPTHNETVSPVVTTNYSIVRVQQEGCINTDMDDVTVNVVANRALAIAGSGNFCTSDSMPVTFSVANGDEYELRLRVDNGTESYDYLVPGDIGDGDVVLVPNLPFAGNPGNPLLGAVEITVLQARRIGDNATLNAGDNPPPFAGRGLFNIQEVKTVAMVSDTTGCFGQSLPVTFTIEGTGEFNISFRSDGNGNVNRTFTASENDSPINILINPSELDLGEHNFVFGVMPTNSLNNSCPIDTIGSGRIYVQPTITSSINILPEMACEGDPVELSFSIDPDSLANITYRVDQGGMSTFNTLNGIQGDSVLADQFFASENITYTITNVEYNGVPSCPNPTIQSKTLQVTPAPAARFVDVVSDTNICFGEEAELRLQFSSNTYPVTYVFTDSATVTRNLTFTNAQGFQDTVIRITPGSSTRYFVSQVTQTNSPGCSSVQFDAIDVTVGQEIVLNDFRLSADTICQGDPLSILIDVDGTPDLIARFTDGVNTFIRTLPNATGFDTLVINPSPQVDRIYTLIDITDGSALACEQSFNVSDTVVVRQQPSISITPDRSIICFGDSVRLRVTIGAEDSVDFTLSDQIDNFVRDFADVGPGTQFFNIRPNLLNLNTFRVDSLQYSQGLSCRIVNPATFTVRTNEIPGANIFVAGTAKDTVVCEGAQVPLRFTVTGAGLRTVFFANDQGFSSSFTIGASEVERTVLVNPFPNTGPVKYFITRVVSNNGALCDSIPMDTVLVNVNPIPTVDIMADIDPRCLNDVNPTTITFNFNGVGPFEFNYSDGENIFTLTADSDNDGDGRLDQSITVAPGKTTTYNVTRIADMTQPNSCVNNGGNAFTLRVNQPAEAELFNNNDVICSGEPLNLSYFIRGKGPMDITFRISDGMGFIRDTTIFDLSTGLYDLAFIDTARTPTNTNFTVNIVNVVDGNMPMCTSNGVGVARVTVNAIPRIENFNTVLDSICRGDQVDINFDVVNGFGNYAVEYSANGIIVRDTILGLQSGGDNASITISPTATTRYRRVRITDLLTGCSTMYTGTIPQDTVVVLQNPVVTVNTDANIYCSDTQALVTISVNGNENPNGIFLSDIFLNGVSVANNVPIDQTQPGSTAFFKTVAVALPAGTPQNSVFTFGEVVDGINLNNPSRMGGCNTNVNDSLRITVNPIATASIANPGAQTICESDTAEVFVNISGNGVINVRLAVIDGLDTLASPIFSGMAANSPLRYRSADFNLVGKSIRYAIDSVSSVANGLNCPGQVGNPSSKTYVIKGNPQMNISPVDTTICQGDDLLVEFDITPVGAGNGPYDFFAVFDNGNPLENDTTEFFNQGNSSIRIITPLDSGVLYVPFVTNRSAPTCFSIDSVGVTINVNPKANAEFVDTVPLAYCEDDQAGFNLRLTGEGQITALYRNLNTNQIDSFTNVAGTYFVPVMQASNTTASYRILAVNDQSTPRCIENNFNSSVTITVYPRPQAKLSGDFTACFGEVSTVGINLMGSNADSVIVYFSDKLNGTIDTSFAARLGSYSMVLAPTDTAFFTIDSIAYVNFGCTITDPALINQDTAVINIRPLPEATIVVPSLESCFGEDIIYDVQFAFDGPYDISYRINDEVEQNASNINGNFLVTIPNATDTSQLLVTSLVYRDIPQCASEDVDSLTVNVNDSLMVNVVDTICNETATGFRFVVEISGGMASSYSFNGTTPLMAMDTLPEILNGIYSFTIQDGSGCPAIEFAGDYSCDCISDAGAFNIPATPLEFCEDDSADVVANYLGGAVLDANDTMLFILHDSPNNNLGNIFATDSIAKFAFGGNLLFNTVYYISAIVADSVPGAAFDGGDRCLSVAPGVPVIFRERSTANIVLMLNDSGEVCNGNEITYRFEFEGSGPFVVTWNDGVSTRTQTFVSDITPPIVSQATIAGNGSIEILSFVDNGNAFPCNTVLNSPLPYTARPLPDAIFDASNDEPCGFDVVDFNIRNVVAGTIYSWLIDGEEFNGNPVSYAFDSNGPALARAYATNAFGCVDSTDRIIDVNLPVKPTITFDGSSVEGRVCRGDALDFTANVIIGVNSEQVTWFLNGNLLQSLASNNFSPAAFGMRGVNTVVAVNEFEGCTNTDTVVFEVQGPGATPIFDDEFCVDEDVLFGLDNVIDVNTVQWVLTGAQSITRNNSNFTVSLPEGFPSNDVVNVELTLTSAAGCTFDTLFDITVHDLDVQLDNFNDFGNLQRHCLGFEDTFVPTQTSFTNNFVTWNYDFGDGNQETRNDPAGVTNNYAAPGIYKASVELVDGFGCRDTDTLNIEILALPIVEALDTFACLDETLVVEATGATSYVWTSVPVGAFAADPITGNQQSVLTNVAGTYLAEVVGTDDEGCANNAVIMIDVYDLESPLIGENYRAVFDTAYKIGYDLPLDYDLFDERYIYSWTPSLDLTCDSCPNPTVTTFQSQNYTLNITDIYGCFDADALVNITIERESSLDMPDAFTPGQGNINRTIGPDGWALETIDTYQIFTKEGSMVHDASGLKEDVQWDGTFNGDALAPQTFTYRIIATTLLGETLTLSGTFDLLR